MGQPGPVSNLRTSRTATSGYLPTLDGWRAIAISLVIVDHASNSYLCGIGSTRWCNALMIGQTGVNLFFGISGFLITSRLLRERDLTGVISLRAFYVRRAFRILPAAVTYLAVMTGLALAGMILLSRQELAGSLFFYRNYLGPAAGFYTGHFWSLAIEEHFYLLWPSLLVALLAVAPRRAAIYTLVLALIVALWRQVALLESLVDHGGLDPNFFMRTDIRLDALLLGAAIALALRSDSARRRFASTVPVSAWCVLAAIYALVATHFGRRPTLWEGTLVPVLVVWTATHPQSIVGRMLEVGALRWVGRISYSLYLWQQFFFPPRGMAAPLALLQRWPLGVPAALACAALSYYVIEKPCIRVGRRLAPPAVPRRGRHYPPTHFGAARIASPVDVRSITS